MGRAACQAMTELGHVIPIPSGLRPASFAEVSYTHGWSAVYSDANGSMLHP